MRIRTQTIIVIISGVISSATTILMAVALARILPKESYGTFRQATLLILLITALVGASLPSSLYYLVPKHGAKLRRAVLTQTLALSCMASVLSTVVLILAAEALAREFENQELTRLLRLFAIYSLPRLVLQLAPAFMISLERPLRAGVYTIASEAVRAAAAIGFACAGGSVSDMLTAMTLGATVLAVVAVVDMYVLGKEGRAGFDREVMRQQLSYLAPLLASVLVGVFNVQFDKFFVSAVFGPKRFAEYAVGGLEVPFIGIVVTSVFNVIMPRMVELWERRDQRAVIELWNAAVRKCALVGYPAFVVLVVCASDLVVLLFGASYAISAVPFSIYLCMIPAKIAVYGAILRAAGDTKPIFIGAVVAAGTNVIVTTGGYWIAARHAGPDATITFVTPTIGTVAAHYAAVIYLLRKIRHRCAVPLARVMPWAFMARIGAVAVAAGGVAFLATHWVEVLSLRLTLRAAVFVAALAGAVVLTNTIEDDDKDFIRSILGAIIRKVTGA